MKLYKPTTSGQRGTKGIDYSVLTKKKPEKGLLVSLKRKAGRARSGRITVRRRGGGAKRLYRVIDFGQSKLDIPAEVIALEYDPYRTAFIVLIQYQDESKQKAYILAPQNLKVGDTVMTSEKGSLSPGNRLKLKNIPVGTMIYNVELERGRGGKIVRSAGSSARVLAHEDKYTNIEMPSKEIRKVSEECFASIGMVSNPEHRFINLGKAGRSRYKGRRPKVRGSAMNPCDHPHGGGEGRTGIGLKHPKTPWGKPAYGVKTRKKKKWTNKLIIKPRKKKKR
ncbi:50S ribosomal protein L2 [Candidatus Parcubacteria bacterium]|nr:50S ribosomal protein L2 [Candidatus Parcubacteria bacterium]